MFFLTLVAATRPLSTALAARVGGFFDSVALRTAGNPVWLCPHQALDLPLEDHPTPAQMASLRALCAADRVDVFITPAAGRRKKLLLADMDATILAGETLDDLALEAGVEAQVADLTRRAMEGSIDFRDALEARLSLLRGLPLATVQAVLAQQMPSPGAATLISTLRAHGVFCVLVSGGFTLFTAAVAKRLGFHAHEGNVLHFDAAGLSGLDPEAALVDKDRKLALLHDYAARLGGSPSDVLALGDGANDLPMLQAAGTGIGYRPKPKLAAILDNQILYGDLTAALYALGYHRDDLVLVPDLPFQEDLS